MREFAPGPRPAVPRPVSAVAVLALVATACAEGGPAAGEDGSGGELAVFAAASLMDVFEELGEEFEAEHSEVEVTFNFAGSSELAVQINSGAPADVFAAANTDTMAQVVEEGGLADDWADEHGDDGALFAVNTLQIAVPEGNPAGITDFTDLADGDVAVAFCAEEVPCGTATVTVMEAFGTQITPVTYEDDVRAVLTKVELGEVDAGLVYATDVIAAEGNVEGIDFPTSEEAINEYPIGVLAEAENPDLAEAWVELVLSETGVQSLEEAGFGAP